MRKIAETVSKGLDPKIPKFGLGHPREEVDCPNVHAFVACYGVAGAFVEKRRFLMKKDNTLADVKKAFIESADHYKERREAKGQHEYNLRQLTSLELLVDQKRNQRTSLPQDLVGDESDFIFGSHELKKPLWHFSNKCKVNVAFFYSEHIRKPFETQVASEKNDKFASLASFDTSYKRFALGRINTLE